MRSARRRLWTLLAVLGLSAGGSWRASLEAAPFVRGDANADGRIDVSDPIFILGFLFLGGHEPLCRDAADANDDAGLDLSDAIRALESLFRAGGALPGPFPGCGADPTDDGLDCRLYPPCSPAAFYVNAQIDAERADDGPGLRAIAAALKERGITTTVYVSADFANREAILVEELFLDGFEIALHGFYPGEQLASMTYAEQKDLLTRARTALEGCAPCGTYKPVIGFRPQYFSQNEDTYRILDELGFKYDGGFKARQLFLPGHEADAAPYRAEGHGFQAVPITTVEYGGSRKYLCDMAAGTVDKYTGAQWSEMLDLSLDASIERGDPLVLLIHAWYTADEKYGYWQPFLDFLDAAGEAGTFVTTAELTALYNR